MIDTCNQCGNEYKRIAQHWNMSDCERPSFTDNQREIITGLLMGDGNIHRSDYQNPYIESQMISKNYLQYINKEFGIFGKGVSLKLTAEENAKNAHESGFSSDAKGKNYSNIYRWQSMSHPELQEFAKWYSSGEKVWPADIELTPTVLKNWYCGDGHWDNSRKNNYIKISMANEINNTQKINKMFKRAKLPQPNAYSTSSRKDGSKRFSANFTVEQSKELWDYMGEPLPDFEYKWPKKYY